MQAWQRLALARTIFRDGQIVILDEPTSALDVRSEHLIRETLLELQSKMTIIVIAHRLSTLDTCSRIMVIQSGEIKAFDAPQQLVAVHPAPCRDVVQRAGVGAMHLQGIAITQFLDPLLGADNRQRTDQVLRVQGVAAHTCHSSGMSSAAMGATSNSRDAPSGSTTFTSTLVSSLPCP